MMNADEQVVLQMMRADNLQSGFPFAPRGVWEKLCRDFDQTMSARGVPKDDLTYFNQSFSQGPPGSPRYYRYAVYMLYRLVRQRDTTNLLERVDLSTSNGQEIVIGNRQYSWDTLISVDTLLSIAEIDPGVLTQRRVVADLGGGWGRIGWALKKINPLATYVALDLPEILLIAMTTLPRLLPNERVSLYPATRQLPSLSKSRLLEQGLWFAGSQDLRKIDDRAIDIFINVASFQEMKLSQVKAYFDLIDRKVSGLFYTQQYVVVSDAQRAYGAIAGVEEYPFKPTWTEHFNRYATFSERFFEACFGVGVEAELDSRPMISGHAPASPIRPPHVAPHVAPVAKLATQPRGDG